MHSGLAVTKGKRKKGGKVKDKDLTPTPPPNSLKKFFSPPSAPRSLLPFPVSHDGLLQGRFNCEVGLEQQARHRCST